MEVVLDVARVAFGGLVLYLGAEWLVKGSAGLARAFGVKPLIVGLTVVAYGTSAPELAVSAAARIDGSSDIVLGNVIGSCVANLGLILGLTALISPPSVDGRLIKREVPVLILSAAAVPFVLWGGLISYVEAAVLLGASFAFTLFTLTVTGAGADHVPSAEQTEEAAEVGGAPGGRGKLRLGLITLVGLGLLIGGGELFVEGARGLALAIGMSERLVGLTIVALGTSLPELAASVVAALRGYSGLAVGNVVGSNIFNIFLVLGAVGLIEPLEGDLDVMRLDIGFLLGMTLLGVVSMRGARRISRVEGALLLAGYVAFLTLATVL